MKVDIREFKKILIFGVSGAGKTTFARRISKDLDFYPVFMDQHLWLEYWKRKSDKEFIKSIDAELECEKWVLEGALPRFVIKYAHESNIVIWIKVSKYKAIFRVISRMIKNRNRSRVELPDGCVEKLNFKFLSWIWHYSQKEKLIIDHLKKNNIKYIITSNWEEFLSNHSL